MSEHMTEWLGAYMDGELHGIRLQRVQAHLAACPHCQSELDALHSLSAVLHEAPADHPASAERFVSQVNLRLPHRRPGITRSRVLEIGWWMIPLGLLGIWLFMSSLFIVQDLLSAAGGLGWVVDAPPWLVPAPGSDTGWSAALARAGLLSGPSLQWAERTEAITRMAFSGIAWNLSIALVYLSWIAVWWARIMHQGRGQPLNAEAATGRS